MSEPSVNVSNGPSDVNFTQNSCTNFEVIFQDTSDTESLEDEIEPKLKYVRLSNDLQNILLTSSATCIGVHPKVNFM